MKTFEQWLKEDAPGSTTAIAGAGIPTAQPQTQQPQAQQSANDKQNVQQQGPSISVGMEALFVKQLTTKISMGDSDVAEEMKEIFDTGGYYLSNGGPQRVKQFFDTIKQSLKLGNRQQLLSLEKYMDDAEKLVIQNQKWDGKLPNLLIYDPTWAQQSFSQYGDGDTVASTFGELLGNLGRFTQGATQRSVFNQQA